VKRIILGWTLAAVLMLLCGAPAAQAQPPQYRPLGNAEMAPEVWSAWVETFNALSGKQKAEVVRRHVNLCLETLSLADNQRALIKSLTAKFVTEQMYSETDPAKRAAAKKEMQPEMLAARPILGDEVYQTVFSKKPPIAVLEAVKNDPAFR